MSAVLQRPSLAQEAFAAAQREIAALNSHQTMQQQQQQEEFGTGGVSHQDNGQQAQGGPGGMPIGMAPAEVAISGELDLNQLLGLSGPTPAMAGAQPGAPGEATPAQT